MMKLVLLVLFSITLVQATDSKFEAGKAIYKKTCISCHGEQGSTNPYMSLIVKPRKLSKTILSHEQSFQVIKEGGHYWGAHSDIMPAFKHVLDDNEIEEVTYYITKAFNSKRNTRVKKLLDKSDPITDAQKAKMMKMGKKIFNRNCSMCHGITGNGESEYVEQSKAQKSFIYPYDLRKTLLDEDQIFLYSKYGGKYWGTIKTDMPSWKKKYNDFQLKSVAKYVNEKIKKSQ